MGPMCHLLDIKTQSFKSVHHLYGSLEALIDQLSSAKASLYFEYRLLRDCFFMVFRV